MLTTVFNRWKKPQTREELLESLAQWFASEAGSKLLEKQREQVTEVLSSCFGYYLLQLSADASLNLFNDCRVQKKYQAHPFSTDCSIRCNFDEVPFANESLDVVIVHHVHEFASNAHQVLREMQRVVIPNGHLIIIGFNPWSRLGIYSNMAGLRPGSMWQNQLISSRRMKDWLNLLGFEPRRVEYGFHSPQYLENKANPWMKDKLLHWPLGNFYVVSAVKKVATMTPIKMRWVKPRKQFAGLAPVKHKVTHSVRDNIVHKNPLKEDVA